MKQQEIINPFVGLRSFEKNEQQFFFGRDNQIVDIIRILKNTYFAAVIGPSGIGKSSLIKSGLIPALESGCLNNEKKEPAIGIFRPGYDPIKNLAQCFCEQKIINDRSLEENYKIRYEIESILTQSDDGINKVFEKFIHKVHDNLVIIIDQFEELFIFSEPDIELSKTDSNSVRFLNLILKTLKGQNKNIYILVSLRSDYLGNCTIFNGLPEILNKGQYLVPRMTKEEIELTITGPVNLIGATISSELVNVLVNDAADKPDQLPLLQHAMMRVVDFWKNHSDKMEPIDLLHYNAIGKLDNALSNHANEAYNELNNVEDKLLVEKIFKALTDLETNSIGIRRPCKLNELTSLLNVSEEKVIELTGIFRLPERSFLSPVISRQIGSEDFVDISHECLIREWDRLNEWLNEELESSKTYRDLCKVAALFQEGKGSLLTNPELEVALNWKERFQPTEHWAMRYDKSYIRAISFLDQSKENHEFETLQKEIASKNKIKRTKIFSAVISVAFIVALSLAVSSWILYNDAEQSKIVAQNSEEVAHKSEEESKKQAAIAKSEEQKAKELAVIAQNAKLVAQESDSLARLSRDKALLEEAKAKEAAVAEQLAANEAKQAQKEAQDSEIKANNERKKAVEAENEANRLKNIAESVQEAFLAVKSFDLNDSKKGTEIALNSYNKFISNSKNKRNTDIYLALNRALNESVINNNYMHSNAIKEIEINSGNEKMGFIDEKGDLFVKNSANDTYKAIPKLKSNSDAVCFTYSKSGEFLIIGTDKGELRVFNSSTQTEMHIPLIFENAIISIKPVLINSVDHLFILEGNTYHLFKIENKELIESDIRNLPVEVSKMFFIDNNFSKLIVSKGNSVFIYSIGKENQ